MKRLATEIDIKRKESWKGRNKLKIGKKLKKKEKIRRKKISTLRYIK